MNNIQKYLSMQHKLYENMASVWNLKNRDPVVGFYDEHNNWEDYDNFLFKGIDTKNLIALEYGSGPGRNIIKFWNKFFRIDGVDISEKNIENAYVNLNNSKIFNSNLYVNDGKTIPVENEKYDIVFSTICLQHICVYEIRYMIMEEIYRVLKVGGKFCFQMGFGKNEKDNYQKISYYENFADAKTTNGGCDVVVLSPNELKNDLEKIGFKNFDFDIRPVGPGDSHKNWIFVRVEK